MKEVVKELFKRNEFYRDLFDSIPTLILVMDETNKVYTINDALKSFLGIDNDSFYLKKGGHLLHCINTRNDPNDCGTTQECQTCELKNAALTSIKFHRAVNTKMALNACYDDQIKAHNFLIRAVPFVFEERKLALIFVEDISIITELQGLLPMCAHCKMIRNKDGNWVHLEEYIQDHSEATFTHDICPKCIAKLYPKYFAKG